jgi:hypothetical protein
MGGSLLRAGLVAQDNVVGILAEGLSQLSTVILDQLVRILSTQSWGHTSNHYGQARELRTRAGKQGLHVLGQFLVVSLGTSSVSSALLSECLGLLRRGGRLGFYLGGLFLLWYSLGCGGFGSLNLSVGAGVDVDSSSLDLVDFDLAVLTLGLDASRTRIGRGDGCMDGIENSTIEDDVNVGRGNSLGLCHGDGCDGCFLIYLGGGMIEGQK